MLNQNLVSNLNRTIDDSDIEIIIKSLSIQKDHSRMVLVRMYQTFNEELLPVLLELFHKIQTE